VLAANVGTLTSVQTTTTASTNDAVLGALVIRGPFLRFPDGDALDANPTGINNDLTSPFACPATGTLGQANEVVIGVISSANSRHMVAAGGFNLAFSIVSGTENGNGTEGLAMEYLLVSSTSTVTPSFTAIANPGSTCLLTASFKAGATTKAMLPFYRPQRVWRRWG
jgi:hypothetical protein